MLVFKYVLVKGKTDVESQRPVFWFKICNFTGIYITRNDLFLWILLG